MRATGKLPRTKRTFFEENRRFGMVLIRCQTPTTRSQNHSLNASKPCAVSPSRCTFSQARTSIQHAASSRSASKSGALVLSKWRSALATQVSALRSSARPCSFGCARSAASNFQSWPAGLPASPFGRGWSK